MCSSRYVHSSLCALLTRSLYVLFQCALFICSFYAFFLCAFLIVSFYVLFLCSLCIRSFYTLFLSAFFTYSFNALYSETLSDLCTCTKILLHMNEYDRWQDGERPKKVGPIWSQSKIPWAKDTNWYCVILVSTEDFLKLRLTDRNAIMFLRIECSTFGLCTSQRVVKTK